METLERLEPIHLRSVFAAYRDALHAHREAIDRINVFPVPDGDTGTNMAGTLDSVVAFLEEEDGTDMGSTCRAIGRGALMGGRGVSGVILSQILRTMAASFEGLHAVDGRAFADGLTAASEAAHSAVSRPREGTILTVVREAARAAADEGGSLIETLDAANAAARDALARTPELLPVLREAGVVDAGGAGFTLFLDALLHVVAGRAVPPPSREEAEGVLTAARARAGEGGGRYEVTCLLDAPDELIPAFKERWSAMGDSVVVVGGGGAWRCHIHADEPDAAVEGARDFGRTRDVRITDLADQMGGDAGARPREMNAGSILILGGYGETGRRLLHHLAERTAAPLLVAGRDGSKAQALAAELNRRHPGDRVRGLALDASDGPALRRALDGVALLVNATAASAHEPAIAEAALDAGADLLDLTFAPSRAAAMNALARRAEAAGRCFVIQAGFHPGVAAALVRWAAVRAGELETAWVAGLLRQEGGIPYTPAVDDLVELFRGYRAHVYRVGRWDRVRFTDPGDWPRIEFDFGFGGNRTYPMDLDEMRPLPEMFPTLRRLGFSVAGFDPVTDWVVAPLIMLALPVFGRRAVRPMGRLLCRSTRTFGRPPHGTVVQLHAEGRRDGNPVRLRLALFHEDAYEMTAIPTVSMAEQMLDGTARRPGLHLMGLFVGPDRMLGDAEAMGIRVVARAAQGPRL